MRTLRELYRKSLPTKAHRELLLVMIVLLASSLDQEPMSVGVCPMFSTAKVTTLLRKLRVEEWLSMT
jgi:hypothetical protein